MKLRQPREDSGHYATITLGEDQLTEEKDFVALSDKSVYTEVGLLSRTFLDLCNTGRGNR
jgi:hypothetical protein